MHHRIVIGITGASGAPYTVRFLELMARQGVELHVSASALGRRLLFEEQGIRKYSPEALVGPELADKVVLHSDNDFGAVISSGSFQHDGMVIVPCSSNTMNSIASGITTTLVQRAAMVCLKERRKLLIAHRESPLSAVDIDSMAKLTRAGAMILPLSPGFYMMPDRVEDLIDFMVARLMDQLGYEHNLNVRWKGEPAEDAVSSPD